MKMRINVKKNRLLTFGLISFFTLILTHLNLPFINNPTIMPNYFLALFVACISINFLNLNLLTIFIMGLLIDLLVGQLIGQYALTFIIIYYLNFILRKYFVFSTSPMVSAQHLILITTGLITLFISAVSYKLNIELHLFLIKGIFSFVMSLLYLKIFQYLNNKT